MGECLMVVELICKFFYPKRSHTRYVCQALGVPLLAINVDAHQLGTSGKLENTFLTFLTCYKCKKYSFKKVGAT